MPDEKYCKDTWCSFIKEKINHGEIVTLEITTDSMMPLIRPMDKVTVKGCSARDVRPGDIILFNTDSQLYIHRLLMKKQKDDEMLLITKGDKAFTLDQPITSGEFLGKVINLERNSKIFDLKRQPWATINKFLYYFSSLQVKFLSIARILKHCFA